MSIEGVVFDLTSGKNSVAVGREALKLNIYVDAPGGAAFTERPDWWYDHTYAIETERGLDDREDLFTPGTFSVTATAPTTSATTSPRFSAIRLPSAPSPCPAAT